MSLTLEDAFIKAKVDRSKEPSKAIIDITITSLGDSSNACYIVGKLVYNPSDVHDNHIGEESYSSEDLNPLTIYSSDRIKSLPSGNQPFDFEKADECAFTIFRDSTALLILNQGKKKLFFEFAPLYGHILSSMGPDPNGGHIPTGYLLSLTNFSEELIN